MYSPQAKVQTSLLLQKVSYPIVNRTSIQQRHKEADRKRFGDFEMDLIVDSSGHAILTLTERLANMILSKNSKMVRKQKGWLKL